MSYPVVVFGGSSLEQLLQLLAVAARFAELSNQLHNTEGNPCVALSTNILYKPCIK